MLPPKPALGVPSTWQTTSRRPPAPRAYGQRVLAQQLADALPFGSSLGVNHASSGGSGAARSNAGGVGTSRPPLSRPVLVPLSKSSYPPAVVCVPCVLTFAQYCDAP